MMNDSKQSQRGEIMKRSYFAALLTLACVLGIGIKARAQDVDKVVVTVPFEFVAGGTTLPAGEYQVNRAYPGLNRELVISSYHKGSAFLLPLTFEDGSDSDGQPTLRFERINGRYFLSAIRTPGGVYNMATPRQMTVLAKTNNQSGMPSAGNN
jgi:hypothetical protein